MIKTFVDFIKNSALAWIILLIAALLLALPGQIHEYYRVAAVQLAVNQTSTLATSIILFTIIISLIGYVSVTSFNINNIRSKPKQPASSNRTFGTKDVAASLALLLPFIGLIVGLIQANVDLEIGRDKNQALELIGKAFNEALYDATGEVSHSKKYDMLPGFGISNWLLALAGFASALALLILVVANVGPVSRGLRAMANLISHWPGTTFLIVLALYFSCSYAVLYKLDNISDALGTFGFLSIGFGLILFLLTSLGCYSRQVHLPLTATLILCPIVISILGLNDNDEISGWNSSASASLKPDTAGFTSHMTKLLGVLSRSMKTDNPANTASPTPIYIVAAPGGGLYASYFASTILTQATEEVPSFRQHLLAISSVSGGSLGAALYSALYNVNTSCAGYIAPDATISEDAQSTEISRIAFLRKFHTVDFLAPLTGALFFLDAVQAFIPYPIPVLSRAHAFKKSIKNAWVEAKVTANDRAEYIRIVRNKDASLPKNLEGRTSTPFDCPIDQVLNANSNGPAILFNVTEVHSGRQRVITPFEIDGGYEPDATRDLELVAAAALSARFPYVTPPGWFRRKKDKGGRRTYLVDGGIYENSGVSTAQALIRKLEALRRANRDRNFSIRLIILVGPEENRNLSDNYLSELLSPLRALGQSRTARGNDYVLGAQRDLRQCGSTGLEENSDCQMVVGLKNFFYALPLGWDLSGASRYIIESQRGKFDKCRRDEKSGVVNAACFIEFLKADLR